MTHRKKGDEGKPCLRHRGDMCRMMYPHDVRASMFFHTLNEMRGVVNLLIQRACFNAKQVKTNAFKITIR